MPADVFAGLAPGETGIRKAISVTLEATTVGDQLAPEATGKRLLLLQTLIAPYALPITREQQNVIGLTGMAKSKE